MRFSGNLASKIYYTLLIISFVAVTTIWVFYLQVQTNDVIPTLTSEYRVYYAPVTNFSSQEEDISYEQLNGLAVSPTKPQSTSQISKVMIAQTDVLNLEKIFGHSLAWQVYPTYDEIINHLDRQSVALIPFDQLQPQMKVLKLDGKSILDKKYAADDWGLLLKTQRNARSNEPTSNRDINQLGNLIMTGVTAISRGVEQAISDHNDPIFPARGVMEVLSQADLTHVDNENTFFDSCKPAKEGIVLCGKTRSIDALKAIGADIIDLTGNHQNDYGNEKNLESLQHLTDAGFVHFGGGRNEEDAGKILYQYVGGTKLGFVGYAYFDSLNGPNYVSLAKGDRPGANYYSEEKLKQDLIEAQENADFVIVTYQFIEDYRTTPLPGQIEVFRQTVEYGADLVVGVQAHQPQTIEFYQDKPIFYGLGNFFFDQMWSYPTRQGIIPRYTFYQGKLISIEILTTLLYDYAQPRFTTGAERNQLLQEILPPMPPVK
jgi:hypothetical protein